MNHAVSRRNVLLGAANGFGAIALEHLLQRRLSAGTRVNPLAPKPALKKYEGQPLPASYGRVVSQFTNGDTPLLSSPWTFQQFGQSGLPVSTLFPHIAQCVDD